MEEHCRRVERLAKKLQPIKWVAGWQLAEPELKSETARLHAGTAVNRLHERVLSSTICSWWISIPSAPRSVFLEGHVRACGRLSFQRRRRNVNAMDAGTE